MNAYYKDPVLFTAFMDMIPFLKRLATAPEHESFEPSWRLWSTVGYFNVAFKQRFMGSLATVFDLNELVLTYQAGLQRIADAANLIPAVLLNSVGQEWYGFSVFGNNDQFMRYDFGIMNLPYQCLFRPYDWFGIFHEVGHDVAHKRQILGQGAKPILSRVGILDSDTIGDTLEQNELKITATEIYADMFAFICGFRCDWELYSKKVLKYVFSFEQASRSFPAYFSRAFMILCFSQQDNENTMAPDSRQFLRKRHKLVESLLQLIAQMAHHCNTITYLESTDFMHKIYGFYRQWHEFAQWAAADIRRLAPSHSPDWQKKCGAVITDLESGQVRDDIEDPVGVISVLPTETNDLFRLYLTLSLSYSVCYHKKYLGSKPANFVSTRKAANRS